MPESWKEIAQIIENIPEKTISLPQIEFLYRLSLETRGAGEIVEIGTNVGRSTIGLAFGQKEKGGRPIYSVDIYEHRDIEKNLQAAGVSDFVNRVVESSSSAASRWDKPIELLWIDGDHCYVGVASDIKCWSKFVAPGGVIALHDYPGHVGTTQIWRAVHRTLLARPKEWRVTHDRSVGSIITLEKLDYQPQSIGVRRRLSSHLYWLHRNARSYVFRYFPRLSSKIVQFLKK